MKLAKNGEFIMNQKEVVEFSSWLNMHPKLRYNRFNDVVNAFISFQKDVFTKLKKS